MFDKSEIRYAFTVAVLGLLLVLPRPSNGDTVKLTKPRPAEEMFNKGLAALANNDLAGAEAAFLDSIKLEPKAASSMLGLAQVAAKRGDRKAAADYLQRAFTTAPDSAEVQENFARFKYFEGKPREAEAALRAAAQIDPNTPRVWIDLGDLYVSALKKPSEAIPLYKKAIALDPRRSGAHYALGVALALTGDDAGATSSLNQAAALAANNPLPLYQLGRLHESKGRFDAALDAFTRALTIAPSFAPALYERGNMLVEKKDENGAIREFVAAARANPKFVEPHVRLGMIYQQRKQWTDAEQAYLTAVKLDARQAIAYNNLAWMAAERKVELNEALGWARKAVSIAPTVSQFQTTLGWVQRARGELDQAATTLLKAAEMKPERAEAFYYVGVVQLERGKRADGIASLKKALALNAGFPNAADAQSRLRALGAS